MNKLLHTPLTVHNVELANRLVMPPMATGKTPDGTVQDDLLAYYDARSKGGCIGLIVTEHACQPRGQGARGPALRFTRHRYSGPYKACGDHP